MLNHFNTNKLIKKNFKHNFINLLNLKELILYIKHMFVFYIRCIVLIYKQICEFIY